MLDKLSFPTALLVPGRYVAESDVIIAELAAISGRNPEALPVYRTYATDVLPSLVGMIRIAARHCAAREGTICAKIVCEPAF